MKKLVQFRVTETVDWPPLIQALGDVGVSVRESGRLCTIYVDEVILQAALKRKGGRQKKTIAIESRKELERQMQEKGAAALAKTLGISQATLYRRLREL